MRSCERRNQTLHERLDPASLADVDLDAGLEGLRRSQRIMRLTIGGAERWAETSSIPATSALHQWGAKAEPSTSTAEGCLAAAVVGRSRTDGRAHCDFQMAVPALCFRGRPGAALDVPQVSCVGRARLAKADGHTFGSAILAHEAPIVVARCRVVRSSLEIDTASVHTADGSSKFCGHGYK
jgi:hypothetical protein